MGQARQYFQSQTNAATLTAANSDDFGDQQVTPTGTVTATYDNTHPAVGTMGGKLVTTASAVSAYLSINFPTPSGSGSVVYLFWWNGSDTVSSVFTLLQLQNASNSSCCSANVSTAKKVQLVDVTGTAFTSTTVLGSGFYAIEIECVSDAAAGTDRMRLYSWNAGTQVATLLEDSGAFTGRNTRGGNIAAARAGRVSATNNGVLTYWPGGVRVDDTGAQIPTSSFGISNTPPSAGAGPDQTVDPYSLVTFSSTASDPDVGDTVNRLWSLLSTTSTTTPALSSYTTASPTYTTSGTWYTGHVDTWRLTVTDSVGATATDDVVITVRPCSVALIAVPGGTPAQQTGLRAALV